MKKLLTTLLAGLISTSLSAELPKASEKDMHWMTFGEHPEGICMTLGYDTDGDKKEDTRFHYMVYPRPDGALWTQLDSYAVDYNGDGYFTPDEWTPYVQKENNGGFDWHEPENRREVTY